MTFHNPLYLGLLLIIPFLLYAAQKSPVSRSVNYSSIAGMSGVKPTWRVYWAQKLPYFFIMALVMAIIALARPQVGLKGTLVRKEGVDIVLALDVSTSMLAEDFKITGHRANRLEIVKQVTKDFIRKRANDRIGLVIFAGRPYILSPLTWDHGWAESRLEEVKTGVIEDGTAIGSALATAVSRLQETKAKSKVVILLTDGNNNSGQIPPETAAEAAKALKVTVYTIGAGSKGPVPYPVVDAWGRKQYQMAEIDLDEELLKKVAGTTNGKYFRATDTETLKQIFKQIDQMEKTKIEMPKYQEYVEIYPYFLAIALLILLAEIVLANTILRRLP